ncbi:MAG: multiheme c-type cytochrome, partial [Geminicoccaceae bacterium]
MTVCDTVATRSLRGIRPMSGPRLFAVSIAFGGALLLPGVVTGMAEAAPADGAHYQTQQAIADLSPGSFGPPSSEYQVAEATDGVVSDADAEDGTQDAQAAHDDLFGESRYPSAGTCGTCHPKQYEEWAISQHSYAQLSPVYMAINNFLNFSTSSSMGDFCLRCHNQVGANLGESPFISNLERHPTSREGITCVVCH